MLLRTPINGTIPIVKDAGQTNVKNTTGATNSMLGRYKLLVLGGLGGGDKGYLQGGQNSHNFYTKIIL